MIEKKVYKETKQFSILMMVNWNAKKLQKVNKKLDEITNFFQGFRNPKKGSHKYFFKKALKQPQRNWIWIILKPLLDSQYLRESQLSLLLNFFLTIVSVKMAVEMISTAIFQK